MLSVNFNKKAIEEHKSPGPDGVKKDPYYFTFFNEKNGDGEKGADSKKGDSKGFKKAKKPYMEHAPIHETSIHTDHSSEISGPSPKNAKPLKPQLKSKSQRENSKQVQIQKMKSDVKVSHDSNLDSSFNHMTP